MTPTTTPMAAWLESAWLARYLDRQLGGDEAAWFEVYLLDKPELLGMVEADSGLRDALAAETAAWQSALESDRQGGVVEDTLQDADRVEAAKDERAASSQSSALRRRRSELPRWMALAATLVLGLGVGWIGERSLMDRFAEPSLIANPMHVIYDTMRGEATPPRVEHADSASPYVLIEVAVPADAESIVLQIPDRTEESLTPSPDGFVSFLVDKNSSMNVPIAQITYAEAGHVKSKAISLQTNPRRIP